MVAQGRPSLLVAILQSLCSLIRQCRDRHAGENRILTLECRTDDQHYSIEHGARNVHPQRIQAFMDNLRPQDETFGGQRVFSCERCGEEFPSREELKIVSCRLESVDRSLQVALREPICSWNSTGTVASFPSSCSHSIMDPSQARTGQYRYRSATTFLRTTRRR
jgi:hypothetical protein